jgi:3',5'-cyclic AMP phosphodiesterase CpdA
MLSPLPPNSNSSQEAGPRLVSRGATSEPIWDFRHGDDDDNRMSPQKGGFRGMILSAVLEFNFVKAAVVFLILIIAPALLLGLAPSILATYGRWLIYATTMAGEDPIRGLVLLVILVAIALWIGRCLVTFAFDTLQHLHYTLVFPLFVALRELLRAVAERLLGGSITPQRLDRGRRVGAVVAALLFAAGGLALAWVVERSVGLQILNIFTVHPSTLAKAALTNAAIIVGLSTVADSLYWLWRELTLSGPVTDWTPASSNAELPAVRIAHLSDLHLVGERYGYRMEAGTHGPRGNRRIARAFRKLAAIHAATPLDRILVTGDITDAGTRGEWAEFFDLLRDVPEIRSLMSLLPGNHDVNTVDRTNAARLDMPWNSSQSLRKLRTVLALDLVQGDRAHVVDRNTGELGPTLSDYLRQGKRMERLRALAERGAFLGRWEVERVWESIFPLVEPAQGNHRCGVILLNSNARTHFSLTNAIGFVSPPELRAFKSILRNSPGVPWIIALHHQIVEYPVPSVSLHERVGLALVNASDVLAAIEPYASRTIVLHGHRHWDWIGTCGGVVLCSAPSTMLGSQTGEKRVGSFHVHELAFGAPGRNCLMKTECVKVA